jgi:hypothetical protein
MLGRALRFGPVLSLPCLGVVPNPGPLPGRGVYEYLACCLKVGVTGISTLDPVPVPSEYGNDDPRHYYNDDHPSKDAHRRSYRGALMVRRVSVATL